MDRLKPALEERLTAYYKESIEIDLQFNEEDLADKSIHYDMMKPAGAGKIDVERTATGVKAAFDTDFLRGFLGPDNKGERTAASRAGIEKYWGFSVADMLDYDPAKEAIQERMSEITNARLDHELMQMLDS